MICTSTQLRTKSVPIFNKVQDGEIAVVENPHRPNMVLIRQDTLEEIAKESESKEAATVLADLVF